VSNFKLYHVENMVHFNEMIEPAVYYTNRFSWIV